MVLARALSLIMQPTQQGKADETDNTGLAELLGKCHHKPTTNASDLANYTVGTNMFPFTVLCVPAWVHTGEAISNSSWNTAGWAADCEIAFRCQVVPSL